jgi:hypothetical protein
MKFPGLIESAFLIVPAFFQPSFAMAQLPTRTPTAIGVIPTKALVLSQVSPSVVEIAVRGTIPRETDPRNRDPLYFGLLDLPKLHPKRDFHSAGSEAPRHP